MYYVAFEHNTGHYKGIRFWCCYPDKETFDKERNTVSSHTVVAESENEDEIKKAAQDYHPDLLLKAAQGKIVERLQKAWDRFNETQDRKQLAEEMTSIQERAKYELMAAQLAASTMR